MVIRIEFDAADFGATKVAAAPDLLWELVLSVHTLRTANPPPRYWGWIARAREAIVATGDIRWLRPLRAAIPPEGNFPDFLTPGTIGLDLDTALERVLSTPSEVITKDLRAAYGGLPTLPDWAGRLADGDRRPLIDLVAGMRRYFDLVLEPELDQLARRVELDRAVQARRLADAGLGLVLAGLSPDLELRDTALVSEQYPCFCAPADSERHHRLDLAGRGLTLIPAHFSWGGPIKLIDPALDPVLVYPAGADSARSTLPTGPDALGNLLGRTRARVLRAVLIASSTSELSVRLDVSPASVSEHMGVLRNAGLVQTSREGTSVRHSLTGRGRSLLDL